MRKLEFIEEDGKKFKVETNKVEIDMADVPVQINWLESEIVVTQERLDQLKNDLKELKKLDV